MTIERDLITEDEARAICTANGWELMRSKAIKRICGDPVGICHVPTVFGDASHNDSIYDDWMSCWRENYSVAVHMTAEQYSDLVQAADKASGDLTRNPDNETAALVRAQSNRWRDVLGRMLQAEAAS